MILWPVSRRLELVNGFEKYFTYVMFINSESPFVDFES